MKPIDNKADCRQRCLTCIADNHISHVNDRMYHQLRLSKDVYQQVKKQKSLWELESFSQEKFQFPQ